MAAFVATAAGGAYSLRPEYHSPGCKKPTPGSAQLSIPLASVQQIFTEHFLYAKHCCVFSVEKLRDFPKDTQIYQYLGS